MYSAEFNPLSQPKAPPVPGADNGFSRGSSCSRSIPNYMGRYDDLRQDRHLHPPQVTRVDRNTLEF
jgi:hypothetical protein